MVTLMINGNTDQSRHERHHHSGCGAPAPAFLIPTLCFLKDINEIGACRVCVVEDGRLRKTGHGLQQRSMGGHGSSIPTAPRYSESSKK